MKKARKHLPELLLRVHCVFVRYLRYSTTLYSACTQMGTIHNILL